MKTKKPLLGFGIFGLLIFAISWCIHNADEIKERIGYLFNDTISFLGNNIWSIVGSLLGIIVLVSLIAGLIHYFRYNYIEIWKILLGIGIIALATSLIVLIVVNFDTISLFFKNYIWFIVAGLSTVLVVVGLVIYLKGRPIRLSFINQIRFSSLVDPNLQRIAEKVCASTNRVTFISCSMLEVSFSVKSNTGKSTWNCNIKFGVDNKGNLMRSYQIDSENDDSEIPEMIAEEIIQKMLPDQS